MSILDTTVVIQPSPVQGVNRIKSILNQIFTNLEGSLAQIVEVVDRHGRANIDTELATEAAELATLYTNTKAFVEANKTGTTIADLPV